MMENIKKFKNIISLVAVLGIFALGFSLWNNSKPKVMDQIKFGIVDLNEVRMKSEIFGRLQKKVEEEYKKAQEKALKFEKRLRDLDAEIKGLKQKPSENAKTVQEKEDTLKKEQTQAEQELTKVRDELNKYFERIQGQIDSILEKIILKIVRKKNVQILLNAETQGQRVVVYAEEGLDVTPEILKEFNERTKDLKL